MVNSSPSALVFPGASNCLSFCLALHRRLLSTVFPIPFLLRYFHKLSPADINGRWAERLGYLVDGQRVNLSCHSRHIPRLSRRYLLSYSSFIMLISHVIPVIFPIYRVDIFYSSFIMHCPPNRYPTRKNQLSPLRPPKSPNSVDITCHSRHILHLLCQCLPFFLSYSSFIESIS